MTGELVGGSQEKGAIFRIAGAIEAQEGEFVAGGGHGGRRALQEVFDRDVQRFGDSGDVTAELAGAVGLPLGDGAAGDATGQSEVVLCEAAGAAEGADAGADRFWLVFHAHKLREIY